MKKQIVLTLMLLALLTGCTSSEDVPETTEVEETSETEVITDLEAEGVESLLVQDESLFALGEDVKEVDLEGKSLLDANYQLVDLQDVEHPLADHHNTYLVGNDVVLEGARALRDEEHLFFVKDDIVRVLNLKDGSVKEITLAIPEELTLDLMKDNLFMMKGQILVSNEEGSHLFSEEGAFVQSYPQVVLGASKDENIFIYDEEEEGVIGFYDLDADKAQLITLTGEGETLFSKPVFQGDSDLIFLTQKGEEVVFNHLKLRELKANTIVLDQASAFKGMDLLGDELLLAFNDRFYYGHVDALSYYDQSFDRLATEGETFALMQGETLRVIKDESYQDYSVEGTILDFLLYQDELIMLYEADGTTYIKNVALEI